MVHQNLETLNLWRSCFKFVARYFELPCVMFDSQLYNVVVSEGETVNTLGPHSQWALTTPVWPRPPGGFLPRREGVKGLLSTLDLDGHCLCSWNKSQRRWHAKLQHGALWERGHLSQLEHVMTRFSAGFRRLLKPWNLYRVVLTSCRGPPYGCTITPSSLLNRHGRL